jgi:hypothetical protein
MENVISAENATGARKKSSSFLKTEIYKLLLYAYFLCRDLILIRAGDVSEKQYLKKDTTGL